MLPRAWSTLINDRLSHRLPACIQLLHDRFIATDHDRQRPFTSASITTGDRGIERVDTACFRGLVQLDSQRRFAGRHVDQDATRSRPCQCALLFIKKNLSYIFGEAHDCKHDVRSLRCGSGRIDPRRTALDQFLRLATRSRVYAHLEAGIEQVPTHAAPHHAGANPADASVAWFCRLCLMRGKWTRGWLHGTVSRERNPRRADAGNDRPRSVRLFPESCLSERCVNRGRVDCEGEPVRRRSPPRP